MSCQTSCVKLKPVSFCISLDPGDGDHTAFWGFSSPEITVEGVGHLDIYYKNTITGAIYQDQVLYVKDSNPSRIYIQFVGTEFPLAKNTDYEVWFTRTGETERMLMQVDGIQGTCFLFSGVRIIDGLTNETIAYPLQNLYVEPSNILCAPCTTIQPLVWCVPADENDEVDNPVNVSTIFIGLSEECIGYFRNIATGEIYRFDLVNIPQELGNYIYLEINKLFPLALNTPYEFWVSAIDGSPFNKLDISIQDGSGGEAAVTKCIIVQGGKITDLLTQACTFIEQQQFLLEA